MGIGAAVGFAIAANRGRCMARLETAPGAGEVTLRPSRPMDAQYEQALSV